MPYDSNGGAPRPKSEMLTLTGLWAKEGPNGVYYVGALGGARVMLLKNTRKTDDDPEAPDYNLVLAPRTPKPAAGSGASSPNAKPTTNTPARRYPPAR